MDAKTKDIGLGPTTAFYRGNKMLPTSDVQFEWTPEMAKELKLCTKDLLHFGDNYFWAVTTEKGKQQLTLYKPQRKLLKLLDKNRFVITLASRQVGKALWIDTPIPTPNGWTKMGDLKTGDLVFDDNGMPCKVTKAHEIRYDRPCYKVTFDNGETIIADEEHLWTTQSRNERKKHINGSVKTTKQILDTLTIGSKMEPNHRIAIVHNGVSYSSKILPINPYILGLWLGDGAKANSQICVGKRDVIEIVNNIKETKQFDDIKVIGRKNNSVFTITPTSTELRKTKSLNSLLRHHNLLYNKHIPDIYMYSDRMQRLELLRGLIDSDGYIDTRGVAHFYNIDKDLSYQIKELIESLGYKTTIRDFIPTLNGVKCQIAYDITFYPRENVCKLSFKKKRINRNPLNLNEISKYRNQWHYIKQIKKMEESVPVKCITVDSENSLYLAGKSFIKTHNSTTMTIFSLWMACFQEDKRILIVANREDTAIELLRRIKFAYEMLPNWLKPGIETWGQTSVYFSNGSSIEISATSSTAARGKSINCIDGKTIVTLRDKHTKKSFNINVKDLADMLKKNGTIDNTNLI